jgi:hypothetical protein
MKWLVLALVFLAGCNFTLVGTPDGSSDAGRPDVSVAMDAPVASPDVSAPMEAAAMPDPRLCSDAEFNRMRYCQPPCGSNGEQWCLRDGDGTLRWSVCMPRGSQVYTCPDEAPVGSHCDSLMETFRVCNRSTASCVWLQFCEGNAWSGCRLRTQSAACMPDAGMLSAPDAGASDAMTPPPDVSTPRDAAPPPDATPVVDARADAVSSDASQSARPGCPCEVPDQWFYCRTRCGNLSIQSCRDYCLAASCTPIVPETCR